MVECRGAVRRNIGLAGALAALLGICVGASERASGAILSERVGESVPIQAPQASPDGSPTERHYPTDRCIPLAPAALAGGLTIGDGLMPAPRTGIHPPPVDDAICDLTIQKSGPQQVPLGSTITYTVTVANVGNRPVDRPAITVTDPTVGTGPLVFYAVVTGDADAQLEPGEVWEYRLPGGVPVTLPAPTCEPVTNTAVLKVLADETFAGNNTSTVTTTVNDERCASTPPGGPNPPGGATPPGGPTGSPSAPPTTLKLIKIGRLGSRADRPVPYRIRITNVGSATAEGVWISDRLPAGTALLRRPKGATFANGVIRWRIGSLAPGRSVTVGMWLRSTGNRPRRVCNVARADAGNARLVTAKRCTRLIRVAGVVRIPVTG